MLKCFKSPKKNDSHHSTHPPLSEFICRCACFCFATLSCPEIWQLLHYSWNNFNNPTIDWWKLHQHISSDYFMQKEGLVAPLCLLSISYFPSAALKKPLKYWNINSFLIIQSLFFLPHSIYPSIYFLFSFIFVFYFQIEGFE